MFLICSTPLLFSLCNTRLFKSVKINFYGLEMEKKMIRTSVHITISEEWANIYSWLKYFNEYYDNADQEIQIVLNAIVEEFIKEEQLRNHPLTKDEAVSFLSTIPRNTRNAGRAHKFSAEKLPSYERITVVRCC